MFCGNCGKEIPDDAVFCPLCGGRSGIENKKTEMPGGPSGGSKTSEGTKKKKIITAVLFVSVIVIVAVCIGLFGGSGSSDKPAGDESIAANSKEDTTAASGDDKAKETTADPAQPSETGGDTVSDEAALTELTGLIAQADALIAKADEDYNAATEGMDRFKEREKIMYSLAEKLTDLQKKFGQMGGLDSKVKQAGANYFEISVRAAKSLSETMGFMAKYLLLDFDFPVQAEDQLTSDYAQTVYDWYNKRKKTLDEMTSVPSCLETVWNKYKKSDELLSEIAIKYYNAAKYNDWLRLYSSINLRTRYKTAEDKIFNEILAVAKGENDFALSQRNSAVKLSEEITGYAKMSSSGRSSYEFENDKTNKFNYKFEPVDTVYPALYNTYDAFLILKAGCMGGTREIVVEAEIPGLTQKYKKSIKLDSSYKTIYIKPPALSGDLDLTSAKDSQIIVSMYEKNGVDLIKAHSFPVKIMSINDVNWYTDDFGLSTMDNILCYLTPDTDEIDLLRRNAIEAITRMSDGKMQSFPGYQLVAGNRYYVTYMQAAGVMRALYDMGVRYDMGSFSLSSGHQRVKLPAEVISERSGLCIETSLTVASALQSAGMHAFLIFPPGHAQVAVEVWNDGTGAGEYFLIETTSLNDMSNNDDKYKLYADALLTYDPDELRTDYPIAYYSAEEWMNYLATCEYIIDCNDSRILGLTEFYH